MKIGVLKERKSPPDERVPFTPAQCAKIMSDFKGVTVVVEPSDIRCFTDKQYTEAGITLQEDLSDCDILMGVKEVPKENLIPNKTYFFFSHTIKEQPYNRDLLRKLISSDIRMIDYETLVYDNGARVLGFGRYAGIVGAYNGFLALGKRIGSFELKPANECEDRAEMEAQLSQIILPSDYRIIVTGKGRVGQGAEEVLTKMNLRKVSSEEFKHRSFEEPVYCVVDVDEYYVKDEGTEFDMSEFFEDPTGYKSTFNEYSNVADMYIACHYWDSRAAYIYTRQDMKAPDWNIQLVADISCDIDGPVASTIRPSTIADPHYGYNPQTEKEDDFMNQDSIGVMAVDNLPCELPKDASEDFGQNLIKEILPALLVQDTKGIIKRAIMCENGALTERFNYLTDYVGKL